MAMRVLLVLLLSTRGAAWADGLGGRHGGWTHPHHSTGDGAPQLPAMRYQYTSFATSAPDEAASFCAKYFDAQPLAAEQFEAHRGAPPSSSVRGVRFHYHDGSGAALHHDVYFVHDPTKPEGSMSVEDYEATLHKLHRFDIEETWDWCVAVAVALSTARVGRGWNNGRESPNTNEGFVLSVCALSQ